MGGIRNFIKLYTPVNRVISADYLTYTLKTLVFADSFKTPIAKMDLYVMYAFKE